MQAMESGDSTTPLLLSSRCLGEGGPPPFNLIPKAIKDNSMALRRWTLSAELTINVELDMQGAFKARWDPQPTVDF